jgi:predicted transcriptional regulator
LEAWAGPDFALTGRRLGIYRAIQAQPGMGLREIGRTCNVPNGSVTHHLGILHRFGLVWNIRQGPFVRYFPGRKPSDDVALFLARRASVKGSTQDILDYVQAHPGCNQKALIAAFQSIPRSTIQHHVQDLAKKGFVARAWSGRHNRLSALPTPAAVPTPTTMTMPATLPSEA